MISGRQLAKKHSQPGYVLSKNACDVFIKQILFDLHADTWCCGDFINQFEVDTILETFVYRRDKKFRGDTRWLIILSNVGLIEVDIDKACIQKEYLGLINEFLLHIRNPMHSIIATSENRRKEIGDLAELLALQYERDRLTTAGFPILASLVEHISKIDQSAGYDIRSFCGNDSNPDKSIFIEVKGTSLSAFSFTWTFNEMNTAKSKSENYWIYGYTEVDTAKKIGHGPIKLQDPIMNLDTLGYSSIPLDHFVTQQ